MLLFMYSILEGKTADSPTPSTRQLCLIRECFFESSNDSMLLHHHSILSLEEMLPQRL